MKWPDTVPFDPAQGTVSPAIEALLRGPGSAGPVLLLAVSPDAQRQGWGARCAVALADAFTERGDSVILADLSLDHPELHTLLDTPNDEGLTDVFLFGASLEHTTLTVPGKSFRLIPASAYTPDAREVLAHARWHSVFEELAQHQSKLLIYLPVDLDGADAFSDRVGHTIVLAGRAELPEMRERLASDADVIGVLTPPRAEPRPIESATAAALHAAAATPISDQDFERIRLPKDGAREALIADLRARQRAALLGPPPAIEPLPPEESVVTPAPQRPKAAPADVAPKQPAPVFTLHAPRPARRRGMNRLTWLVILLVLVALGAGAWYLWQTRFGKAGAPTDSLDQRATPAPVVAPPAATPTDSAKVSGVLAYSVAIASYHDLEVALGRLDQLVEQAPNLPFYIGPIDVQGRVFYRIMAGPLPDSASATLLRDTLIVRRIKTISSGWDVLNTRYAFLLGHYARRDDAESQRDIAVSKGVPSYVLESTAPDGTMVYNLYAGAYTGPGDAEFMRSILKSAGFPDNLVERIGSSRT